MTEWLDIVDSDDQVVGRATRDRIHSEGHIHRSSHIALFNTRGEMFVQLRSMNKDNGAGLWDTSAAGHVDSGESYLDCAVRELAEELSVVVAPEALQCVGKLLPEKHNGFEFTEVYTVCSEQVPVLQEEEIDDGVWVTAGELDDWLSRERNTFTTVFTSVWNLVRPTSGTIV